MALCLIHRRSRGGNPREVVLPLDRCVRLVDLSLLLDLPLARDALLRIALDLQRTLGGFVIVR